MEPLSQPLRPGLNGIAADIRGVAVEISQRRSFQERYRTDLQVALDAGGAGPNRRQPSFVPPPVYSEKGLPEPPSDKTRQRTPTPTLIPEDEPAITVIRETLFASVGDVIAQTPMLSQALKTDPARAYFASVALAILQVSLTSLTSAGSIKGVLGREVTLDSCPVQLRPLMEELASVGRDAQLFAEEDDEDAMRLAAEGSDIPEPRMDRVRKILEGGVGHNARQAEGRVSVEGRALHLATRINMLALKLTDLAAFRSYAREVFQVLSALSE